MQAKQAKQAKQPATQAAAPAAALQAVALRGGPALTSVVLTTKPYKATAKHNVAWWAAITQQCAGGPASVAQLVAAGVPTHFIGYTYRNGHIALPQA
jgi:hypothetical protein